MKGRCLLSGWDIYLFMFLFFHIFHSILDTGSPPDKQVLMSFKCHTFIKSQQRKRTKEKKREEKKVAITEICDRCYEWVNNNAISFSMSIMVFMRILPSPIHRINFCFYCIVYEDEFYLSINLWILYYFYSVDYDCGFKKFE